MSSYFNVGKIVATFGLEGEMILVHKLGRTDALAGVDTLFIEMVRDSFLPYFPTSVRGKNTGELYLALEGVHTVEAARALLHKRVYLEEAAFREQTGPDSTLYYLGFTVTDSKEGILGTVAEVVEMPSQLVVKVFQHGRELLIPLNESTLEKIDREASLIAVRLPEGLLDVYRQ
jgi:16S rRNA processing protein RimM